ncbi:hypothetical protein CONLIGDRAFT_434843 [Coniochaeta ligniaria NRRL 30616]|uniref:Uncharacterized protein n=1 Tax=Coniochaeta ligniaria NRRL 30616 TaxID=1408157 RepID=A0A1J7IJ41_9PEZI|nr:hypothetical protein CONLIGDRAFT_434843 [Coniochaeta ligniaria NRRL 30616]
MVGKMEKGGLRSREAGWQRRIREPSTSPLWLTFLDGIHQLGSHCRSYEAEIYNDSDRLELGLCWLCLVHTGCCFIWLSVFAQLMRLSASQGKCLGSFHFKAL